MLPVQGSGQAEIWTRNLFDRKRSHRPNMMRVKVYEEATVEVHVTIPGWMTAL